MDNLDEPDYVAVVYFNDKVLFGDDPDRILEAAVRVIHKLTTPMFVLNIRKTEFLITKIKMLHFFIDGGKTKSYL